MEIRVFGLVLLLVLCAALPAESQNWEAFKKKHIYPSMDERRCTDTIKDKKINYGGICKKMNSFILARKDQVKAVCGAAGRAVRGNLRESNKPFSVVTCNLMQSNPCKYVGQKSTRCITIACEKGFPVHYERERPC
ncbi:ribonuclease-like [Ictalurus punctatus]|uniref:Ribonuclease-like n=1 Tax=Ictalurus punctatus TaxID=7998 RepID=A0A979ER07_ICTPU|nr:ribonuclease-like [Ictalurus punctatus]